MTTAAIAQDAEHARHVYGDRVVDKRLANEEVFARLPRYVTEYLIAKYVKPGLEQEGVAAIKERIKGRIPEADQKEIIKGRLLRDGSYVVIDQLEAEIDLTAGRPWGRLNCLHNETLAIDAGLVERFEPLLNGGLWGTVTVTYDAGRVPRLGVSEFTPFQPIHADVKGYKTGRSHFTTDEWTRLLLRSAGYEAEGLTTRQQWLLLARLVPLVERNVNLIELGPRGTGKTFLLRNVSPSVFTISGGRPSPATLFVNKMTQRVGILGTRKVVVFDEIAATTFPDKEVVATLKDYMESGEFSRGTRKVASDASVVLTGNLDVTGEAPADGYTHLFEDLPTALIDAAFLDRIHGYIPGWEIPKISHNSLARGVGFVTDYFGEVLRELREDDVSKQFDELRIEAPSTVRDERGARRIGSGMLKLLFPDGSATDDDRRACLRFGAELRQRVHNQLTFIAPGEFSRRVVGFAGMVPHDARDLVETQKVQQRDARANRDAIVGEVTGMVVLSRDNKDIGGDVFFTEVSHLPGRSGLSVTGIHGKVLDDSVKTALQAIQKLPAPWNHAAAKLATGQVAVHLVNIADPKDGPSAGIAFVTAMVSAALSYPVRPSLAMTGEVSLHGHVGAVGGIPTKIVAAAHHQRRTIIIPAANASDLREVPDDVLGKIEVVTVDRIEDVLREALLPPEGA
jgi:ATP-dependent Lon protease